MEICDDGLRGTDLLVTGGWAEKTAALQESQCTLAHKLVLRRVGTGIEARLVQADGATSIPFEMTPAEFRRMSPDEFLLALLGTWVASWPAPKVATPQP